MARVEYLIGKVMGGINGSYTGTWEYTIAAPVLGSAAVPIIKCTEAEMARFNPNYQSAPTYFDTFGWKSNADFQSAFGIDISSVIMPGAVYSMDTYRYYQNRLGSDIPNPAIRLTGYGYNTGNDMSSGLITMLEYQDIYSTVYHAGIEMFAFSSEVRSNPKTCSNSFYSNGGNWTCSNIGHLDIVPSFGFYITKRSDVNSTVMYYYVNFACSDGNLYTYRGECVSSSNTPSAYFGKITPNLSSVAPSIDSSTLAYILYNGETTTIKYDLTVVNGSGGGQYNSGESVTIVAQSDTPGAIFARWEFSTNVNIQYGGTNTAAVSFLMPNNNVTATAVFLNPESNTRSVTVQNGSGTGTYEVGSPVTIVADRRENLIFAHWDVVPMGEVDSEFSINWTYGGTNTASASFEMPAYNLVIYAAYINGSGNFPYANGGSSTPAGGGGSWTTPDDGVTAPDLPSASTSAVNAGLITMYSPTLAELQALGEFLWSDDFIADFADNVKKLFTNPMDCIISLHVVPYPAPTLSESQEVRFGMIGSGVNMKRIATQYVSHDCGSIDIPNFSGSFLDYTPHTKYSLFLPFIGSVQLDADEITGKSLNVKYHIDLLTGACVALVSADSVLIASYNGQCSNPMPISGANYSRLLASIIGVIGGVAIAGLSMGAVGAVSTGLPAVQAVNTANSVSRLASAFNETGHWGKGLPGVADVRMQLREAMANVNNAVNPPQEHLTNAVRSSANRLTIAHTITSSVNNIMGSKGQVQHSGSMGGSTGFLGKRTPYLTIIRPRQSIPNNYGHFYGYPSNISGNLANFSGYTVFDVMEATSITGTDGEMEELIELLKGGVYL